MPSTSSTSQPGALARDWFLSRAGQALLASERPALEQALGERPGQPWLWCAPVAGDAGTVAGRGLRLHADDARWRGMVDCALPLPLPSGSFGAVVLQHVARPTGFHGPGLLEEAARILVPGGRLWLFQLNPLAPYRWRWRGTGIVASEPLAWRRRLRAVGLVPDPVSQGVGPAWSIEPSPGLQQGPGLRAAYLLRAEKRSLPLTPVRRRRALPLAQGAAAA